MKIISTRVHGILDYVVSLFIIASPWIFGFNEVDIAANIPIAVGLMAFMYSLFTAYEFGLIRKIPMKVHLGLDALSGIFLAASPWLFNFSETVYLPHLIIGIGEIALAAITKSTPDVSVDYTRSDLP